MNGPIPSAWSSFLLSLLRIAVSLSYMMHGTQKLLGWPSLEPRQGVELMSMMGLAGVIETFGGVLLLVGLFSRPVAFLCAGQMAAAYFMAHAPQALWPVLNGGEIAVANCFVFLYIAAAGPGGLSLDAMMGKSSR